MKKRSSFTYPFFIGLSVEYVIVAFVMERGHKGEVLECGGSVGKVGRKLFGT